MTQATSRGFGPVLANRNFRALWFAQLLAQTSQHAIHFIQMVLIEKLTGSAMHLGLIILAFSLPGVIFSPIAGVAVDRFSKKLILVGSNLIRVFLALSYIAILNLLSGTWELVAIYTVTFLMATLAQFFAPAEAATIPLLVGEDLLLPANSLFTLTMAISQVIGLLILGPLVTSLLQVQGGFILIAIFYLGATLAVSTLPMDRRPAGQHQSVAFGWQQVWPDFREGWHFVTRHRKIQAAMAQLVTVATLVMVMAMIAPGYAARCPRHQCRKRRDRLCAGGDRDATGHRHCRALGLPAAAHRLRSDRFGVGGPDICRHGVGRPRLSTPPPADPARLPPGHLQSDFRHHGARSVTGHESGER